MTDQTETRRVECHGCGADVVFTLQFGFAGSDIQCSQCGGAVTDHSEAIRVALDHVKSRGIAPAQCAELVSKYTYEQMMDMARKGYDDPDGIAPDEFDALCAFNLLRAAGLPCHAPAVEH